MQCPSDDDSMPDVVFEPVPRRTKGRGGTTALFKTLDHPNTTAATTFPLSPHGNHPHPQSQAYAPQHSIEGWIILITGIHEEAQEDDLFNVFGEYGPIKDLHWNLDRRTGFVKGYALIEYENFEIAGAAVSTMNGAEFFGQTIFVDWAFSTGPFGSKLRSPQLNRSRSPRRRY